MSPITHFFMGWAVANAAPSLTKRERAFVTWASVIPDIDGLGIVAEALTRHGNHPLDWWSHYHHVLGHNIGFALLVCAATAVFARQKLKVTFLSLISFHLHLLGISLVSPDSWKQLYYKRMKDLVDQYEPDMLYTDGGIMFEE